MSLETPPSFPSLLFSYLCLFYRLFCLREMQNRPCCDRFAHRKYGGGERRRRARAALRGRARPAFFSLGGSSRGAAGRALQGPLPPRPGPIPIRGPVRAPPAVPVPWRTGRATT